MRNGGGQEVVLQRNGEVVFWDLIPLDGHGNPILGLHGASSYTPPAPGFTNEIRRVSVESPLGAQVDADGYAADGSWTGTASSSSVPAFSSLSSPFSRRMAHVEGERKSALWRLMGLCARIAVYLVWKGWRGVRYAVRGVAARVMGWRREEWEMERRWRAEEREATASERERERDASRTMATRRRSQSPLPPPPNAEAWALLGAAAAAAGSDEDSDGGEWLPEGGGDDEEEDGGGEWDDDDEEEEDEDNGTTVVEDEDVGGTNPLVLYSDLVSQPLRRPQRQSSSPLAAEEEDFAPYLLAHHLAPSRAGPLTRRRYRALLPPSSSSASQQQTLTRIDTNNNDDDDGGIAALSSAIDHRRAQVLEMAKKRQGGGGGVDVDVARWMEEEREKWREGKSRFCVVCTVEERTVVLWPCRESFPPWHSFLAFPQWRTLPGTDHSSLFL